MKHTQSDSEYMQQTMQLLRLSHDPDRQVGAAIVGIDGDIIAKGVNAPPPALALKKADSLKAMQEDPTWKYFMLEHAERNAINSAHAHGADLRGATMYGTLYPCADCARAIITAGIKRLVVPELVAGRDRDEKWLAHYSYAHRLFELAGVQVDFVPDPKKAGAR